MYKKHNKFTQKKTLLVELCASIRMKYYGNNTLLNYDWSEKFKYNNSVLNDVAVIKSLMKKRVSPRSPFFHTKSNSRGTMTFTMKNTFNINHTNWPKVMRSHFRLWSCENDGLITLIQKCARDSGNIKIIGKDTLSMDSFNETHPLRSTATSGCNMYQLESDELLEASCYTELFDIHERRLTNFKRLNDEQRAFLVSIRNDVVRISSMLEPTVECVLLTGHAGSGKTSTLECMRDLGNVSLSYIAITQRLCAAVRKKFNVTAFTFCSFMVQALNMRPIDVMILIDAMSYLTADSLLNYNFTSIDQRSFSNIFKSIFTNVDPDDPSSQIISPNVNVVFLDEISMFSPPVLECFVSIIKAASIVRREKFIVILAGDFMQISPLLTTTMNYEPILGICERVFHFKCQHRIIDRPYLDVVMKLTEEAMISPAQFLEELQSIIPDTKFSPEVKFVYPFKRILEAYELLKPTTNIYKWLEQLPVDFFTDILPLNVFVFTNKEMHYMNLLLAFSILSQFKDKEISQTEAQECICFSTFTKNNTHLVWPITINDEYVIPVLPLIRFFPYRLLTTNNKPSEVYNKCIVHLIDWDFVNRHVIVYCPDIEKILKVSFGTFKMNLCNDILFGIPLELAFCTTYHSSQGLTLTGDVVVSLNNIDYRELFVVLTRVRSSNQIQNIYYTKK